eukprot:Skav200623  [mRNA]  locus=scaffold2029:98474:100030:+ [translate_table: standard]
MTQAPTLKPLAAAEGLVLVLQYCPGGNLSSLLQREGHLPEAMAKLYTAEADPMMPWHQPPWNVVLDEDAHAVLTDFGLSKEGVDALYGTKLLSSTWLSSTGMALRHCYASTPDRF